MDKKIQMSNENEHLYPQAPNIDDIITVVKGACIIEVIGKENKIEKYQSPELHYMVYKSVSSIDKKAVLNIVCIEFAKFYVIKYDETVPLEKSIQELLDINSRMVAEHIRKNVFECENCSEEDLIKEIQTDTMKNFWYVNAMYDLKNSAQTISKNVDEIVISNSDDNTNKKFSQFLTKVA